MGYGNRRLRFAATALLLAVALGLAFAEPDVGGGPVAASGAERRAIGKSLTPLDGRQAQLRECTLGDLVADAARATAKADLALVQASELREVVIPAGDLEEDPLRGSLLFPDEEIAVVEIKADKIRAALERGLRSLSDKPQPSAAFLQISGVAVTFRSDKPENQRVESITLGGQPLAADKVYKVAVPVSLAKGTLGYFRVFNGLKMKQAGVSLGQAVGDYVRASKSISITAGQRLRDVSPPRH
jgi:2',3'-cyclic-nucleotide 2'-phosphodiesterase (5'-nucleotidase family)